MKKPVVGLVLARTAEDHHFQPLPAYRFQFLKEQYYEALESRGLLPVGIPATARLENLPHYRSLLCGLLLVGGEDINPTCFGEEIDRLTQTLPAQRDRLEIELVQACRADRVPIFGICRGLQLINVAHGGSLYQDLSYCHGAARHTQVGELDFRTHHEVSITPGTRLHSIIGHHQIQANTGHHQAIKKLGAGLQVSARAGDGVIEAIEGAGFTLAVQWHPESWQADEASRRLFAAFADAVHEFAAAGAGRRRDDL